MAAAYHDVSLKEERNIEKDDGEFYYGKARMLLGEKVEVFPQTKRISRYLICKYSYILSQGWTLFIGLRSRNIYLCSIDCNLGNSF